MQLDGATGGRQLVMVTGGRLPAGVAGRWQMVRATGRRPPFGVTGRRQLVVANGGWQLVWAVDLRNLTWTTDGQ